MDARGGGAAGEDIPLGAVRPDALAPLSSGKLAGCRGYMSCRPKSSEQLGRLSRLVLGLPAPERFASGRRFDGLSAMGHDVGKPAATIGGGMSMVMFTGGGEEEAEEERAMVGACCWRADGTPMGMAGGYAMSGARFSTGGLDVSAWLSLLLLGLA